MVKAIDFYDEKVYAQILTDAIIRSEWTTTSVPVIAWTDYSAGDMMLFVLTPMCNNKKIPSGRTKDRWIISKCMIDSNMSIYVGTR